MWFKSTVVTCKVQGDSTLKVQISRKKHCYLSSLLKFIALTAQKTSAPLHPQSDRKKAHISYTKQPPKRHSSQGHLLCYSWIAAVPFQTHEEQEARHHKLWQPYLPSVCKKTPKVLVHYTKWECYPLLKAAGKISSTTPALSMFTYSEPCG